MKTIFPKISSTVLLVTIGYCFAEIIPQDLRINWMPGVNVGVPGGIPNRTTLYTTLNPGATAAQINAAIKSCPDSQVVKLSAGTYNLDGMIYFDRSNVTLRGAGMGQTILNVSSGSLPAIKAMETGIGFGVNGTISSGYARGSTSVTLSNVTNNVGIAIEKGSMVRFFEGNDTDVVWSRWGHPDLIRQPVYVTGVNGNTISFTPPLVYSFQASLNPRFAQYYTTPVSFVGVEDITINQISTGQSGTVWFSGYANWFKDIAVFSCGDIALELTQSVFNEVRGCWFAGTNTQNEGYGVVAYAENTGLLVEDNIFDSLWTATMLNDAMGSVVAYNYSHNMFVPPLGYFPHQTPGFVIQHMPHGMMTLWEGNIGQQIQSDGYHGSGSHQTIFRNWFHGLHPYYTTNRKMIDLCRYSYYHNVVGNVLGDASWAPNEYQMTGSDNAYSHPVIYRLGYPNSGNNHYSATNPPGNADDGGFDPKVEATLLRHGNYDYFNKSTLWDPAIVDQTIPASLVHSSKPSWFGNVPWPPIGPDVAGYKNKIPAQLRYEGVSSGLTEEPAVRSSGTLMLGPVISGKIQYQVSQRGDVRLEVYDLAGKLLHTPVDGIVPAGAHTAVWNAKGCASGVYLAKLRAGKYSVQGKAIILE